jgi:signal transduction histidine kinase/PAS domain-containing protein
MDSENFLKLIDVKFHGHYGEILTWLPWFHVSVSAITSLAYFAIAVTIAYYLHKKRDIKFYYFFLCFSIFLGMSGIDYALDAYTRHIPEYSIAGWVRLLNMLTTIFAAIYYIPKVSEALHLPSYTQTVKELRKSEQYLNDIIASIPVPLALYDYTHKKILFINPGFKSSIGYDLKEITEVEVWWELAYPNEEYRAKISVEWEERIKSSLSGASNFLPLEAEISCKNGEVKTFLFTATPIKSEVNGTCLVFLYDMTGERENQRKLEENTQALREEIAQGQKTQKSLEYQTMQTSLNFQRLESLVSILQNPCKDVNDFLEYTLQEALKMTESQFGYIYTYSSKDKEFTLNSWSNGVMAKCSVMDQKTKYALEATGLWGEAVRQGCPIIDNDYATGSNPYKKGVPEGHVCLKNFLTIPIFNNEEIVLVVGVANKKDGYTQMDILHLTMLMDSAWKMCQHLTQEKEQDILREKMGQGSKMEAIGRLAGGIAHDFNNKLTVIIGYMDLLKSTCTHANEFEQGFMDEVLKAATQSTEITRKLLIFSRDEPTIASKIDMNIIIEGAKKSLPRLIGEDIKTEFNLQPDLWKIFIDPIYVDQIVMNLATNSRDAMPDGGVLSVATSNVVIDESFYNTLPGVKPGEYVQLVISDTGSGINPVILSRIFEPFFTTKQVGKGTGLGLSIIYGIVTKNEGHIFVRSDLGFGTVFSLYFPRTYLEGQSEEESNSGLEVRGNGTILIVEDELIVLELANNLLSHLGYTIITANSPSEAIQICSIEDTKIDLVLSDIIMPEMNGKEMGDIIRQTRPNLPILYMSGYTAEVISSKGIFEGKVDLIHKPFIMVKLSEKIARMLLPVVDNK